MRAPLLRYWPWLVLVIATFAFSALRPWLEPDEGRYAEIPREMLATGDWITPRLNGLDYFEKPPLQYWATAAVYSVLGVNEFSSRLYGVTLALLSIPLAYLAARRIHADAGVGRAAAVVVASSPYFLLVGQLNLLDGAFATLLSGAVVAFILAQLSTDSRRTRMLMLVTWCALAAALLQKGIVVLVLCAATLVIYTALSRDWSVWRRLYLLPGLATLLAIVSGWFVLVARRNPGFLEFFFVHEHVERFLTTIHHRVEPWWYFLPIMLLAIAPWLGQLLPAVRAGVSPPATPSGFRPSLFALLWCGVVIAFFSASGSKLAPYVMPAVPLLAVVLAPRIAARDTSMPRAVYAIASLLLLAGIGLVVSAQRRAPAHAVPAAVVLWTALACVAAVAGIAAARCIQKRGHGPSAWQAVVACAGVGWSSLMMAFAYTPPPRTSLAIAAELRHQITPTTALYSVGQYRQTLPPYLGRTMHVAHYEGELAFGLGRTTSPVLSTLTLFTQAWARESDAVAFVSHPDYALLAADGLPGRVIGGDQESVVIARR